MKYETEKYLLQAEDFLEDAKILLKAERFKGCANRSYYAMFATVQALLFEINIFTQSHSGLHNAFNLNFIKTEIFPIEIAKIFTQAFDKRQKSDYDYDATIKEEEVVKMVGSATSFLEEAKKYLKT